MTPPPAAGAPLPRANRPQRPSLPSKPRPSAAGALSEGKRLFPKLSLAPRVSSVKEGRPAVQFADLEVQAGFNRLKFAVVVKFSGGMPSVDEARRSLSASWALEGPAAAGRWDPRHLLVILQSEDDVVRALSSQIRRVGSFPFRLFRWSPEFSTKREPPEISSWIKLPGLPLGLFDEGFIGVILSSVGKLIAVDDATKAFTRPSAARACVELDVQGSRPDKVWVGHGSTGGFWQRIVFEDRLAFCSCKHHGHEAADWWCSIFRPRRWSHGVRLRSGLWAHWWMVKFCRTFP